MNWLNFSVLFICVCMKSVNTFAKTVLYVKFMPISVFECVCVCVSVSVSVCISECVSV